MDPSYSTRPLRVSPPRLPLASCPSFLVLEYSVVSRIIHNPYHLQKKAFHSTEYLPYLRYLGTNYLRTANC